MKFFKVIRFFDHIRWNVLQNQKKRKRRNSHVHITLISHLYFKYSRVPQKGISEKWDSRLEIFTATRDPRPGTHFMDETRDPRPSTHTWFVDMWDLGSVFGPKNGQKEDNFWLNSENRTNFDVRNHKKSAS